MTIANSPEGNPNIIKISPATIIYDRIGVNIGAARIKYISHLPSANISDIYLSPIVVFLLMCLVPVLAAAIKYKRMVYCYIFSAITACV